MSISSEHPEYTEMASTWTLVDDAMAGEEAVKAKAFVYLPPTPGQVLDGAVDTLALNANNQGMASYRGYLSRASFPDYFEAGVETLVGILNAKPATFKVPEAMAPVLEKFTAAGENIHMALRRVHAMQLQQGRVGVFVDMPSVMNPDHKFPYCAIYKGTDIKNWDEGETVDGVDKLKMVVLKEVHQEREGLFGWKSVDRYRLLTLGDVEAVRDGESPSGDYRYAVLGDDTTNVTNDQLRTPTFDGRTLQNIPFYFINSKDMLSRPDKPPLLGLARMCYAIYRSDADYRRNLFNQGEDTLVVIGGVKAGTPNPDGSVNDDVRIGAGARLDVNNGGDAKFIGFQSAGLAEQRQALDADRKAASVRTGQLLAPGKSSMESGEALKTRVAAQTATLASVATTAAAAMEAALKDMAVWMGLDPKAVTVAPNLEFVNANIEGQDVVQVQTAKNLGAPISAKSVHAIMAARGMTKMSFEEEMEALEKDPEVLKKIVEDQQSGGSLTGNNPVQSAGGPKKGTQGDKTGTSNAPKK